MGVGGRGGLGGRGVASSRVLGEGNSVPRCCCSCWCCRCVFRPLRHVPSGVITNVCTDSMPSLSICPFGRKRRESAGMPLLSSVGLNDRTAESFHPDISSFCLRVSAPLLQGEGKERGFLLPLLREARVSVFHCCLALILTRVNGLPASPH